MIIDLHTHNLAGEIDRLANSAQRNGIDRFVCLGDVLRCGERPTAAELRQLNDETLAAVRARPAICRGFCYLNADLAPDEVEAELRRCLVHPEFRGVKLHISIRCRSRKLDRIMVLLEKFDRVLLHHAWREQAGETRAISAPADIADLARRFPRVPIVMAHLAGCGFDGVEAVAACPNVRLDTSGSQPEYGFIEYAVKRLGAARLLYGSDAPIRDFAVQRTKVTATALSGADQERILWQNARELLQW